MQAWTTVGKPEIHPEPWGRPGAFSTFRVYPNRKTPFLADYLDRLLDSARRLNLSWIPDSTEISGRLSSYLSDLGNDYSGLMRICLFDDLIGLSDRPANSDGNPVEGWLLNYRRPEPLAKSTAEKDLYGALSKLEVEKEDWIIIDPKDNNLRETATSNLIFSSGKKLLIPEKFILQGIVLRQLLPHLNSQFSVTRGIPQDSELSDFDEILLCGTGRGVAPLSSLSELGWNSRGDIIFNQVRQIYDSLIEEACA
ncbi:MAG: aminotransferase class IV [Opitutales bacterium]|nr:aminotransferase class IV [Opitutales bacterium]